MESTDIPGLVRRLGMEEDSTRKMAAFRLQSMIGDPSFAEAFITEGGLPNLQYLCLHATGNTLAYSLTSMSKLLELDKGWDTVGDKLVERVVQLVVNQPLVNILRGAMSILVSIVSFPHSHPGEGGGASHRFGFKALKPSIAIHPQFLGMLVSRLSSGDHVLSANALQLVNSLMRDALTNDTDAEWSRFIKKLQDLGVIKAVYILMQSTALTDLAHPLLEFQQLTKMMLKKWRDVAIDMEKAEHRRALRAIDSASHADRLGGGGSEARSGTRRGHPERWRRLGFETESPAWEFEPVGFLGMMDMTDFVRKDQSQYQKLLLEQSNMPAGRRCPLARASLSVTAVLYEHFEIDKAGEEGGEAHHAGRYAATLDSRASFDWAFKPLLLHWSRLHTAGLNSFLRLWKTTGAEMEDFGKVEDLVRILVEQVVGQAPRIKEMSAVEEELHDFDYLKLRELQMELLELTFEDAWGNHLRQVRDELHHEALQFIKEQRIRCLLEGDWFPHVIGYDQLSGPVTVTSLARNVPTGWRYVRLSHNRRYLHYADFDARTPEPPAMDMLWGKIDLSIVSSVDSKVSTSRPSSRNSLATITNGHHRDGGGGVNGTAAADANAYARAATASASTTLTIHGLVHTGSRRGGAGGASLQSKSAGGGGGGGGAHKETALLTLHPQSRTLASEWLDGLLMLLNQQPITNDTQKLVRLISGYGLRIRLLNVRFEDVGLRASSANGDGGGGGGGGIRGLADEVKLPSREGLDDQYYYDVAGA